MGERNNRICVFSGSNPGARSEYAEAAIVLGNTLAARDIALVYGGAKVGLMGVVADAVLAKGGEVIGVIPRFLDKKEITHDRLNEIHIVSSMHERKAMMSGLAGGFIALPGGLGTFEEILEVLTWGQLGLHGKPCAALNICQYFDHLLQFLDHAVQEQFLKPAHRDMLIVEATAESILEKMENHEQALTEKRLDLKYR